MSDTLIVFPFLFAVYMIIEIIESAENKEKIESALSGKYSPLVASAVGIVPECGFSVMCAKLYDKGLIGIGALISAFISTNDEGLIVLLSSGTKGKRFALPNSEIMIHQPLGGAQGQASDIAIQANEILKTKKRINDILAQNTSQPLSKIEVDTDRDFYMTAEEAEKYGLVDKIFYSRK